MIHVVYCDNTGKKGEKELDKIISGTKTAVVRSAVGRKIPHSRVFAGEELYFMQKGSLMITAKARVKSVENYVKLSEDGIKEVFDKNASALALTPVQRERWSKKCVCIVHFDNVESLPAPLNFQKQTNMDDWLIIENIGDVLVGTSIPFNYEKAKLK